MKKKEASMLNRSIVYFLKLEQAGDLPNIMDEAGTSSIISKGDFVAMKMHLGEKGNIGHVKPEFIKPVIKKIKDLGAHPFVTDANTIYRGERIDAIHHLMVASEHNFHPKFLGTPVVIADGLRGSCYVEVDVNLKHFKKVKVAEAIYNADAIISIAHFKGHELCGIGGAIKNIGMGCAARSGKYEQHNTVVPKVNASLCTACGACVKWCGGNALLLTNGKISLNSEKCIGCGQCILACNYKVFSIPWNENAFVVQEKMAEYTFGILKNKRTFFINFLTFITRGCDCFKTVAKPLIPDIGILASTDPVAIDQACLDLVTKEAGHNILKEETGMDGGRQIEYAERLGLGSRRYQLKTV